MTITIDNKPCVCQPGETLLNVAERNGIHIPTLCHHEGLPGQACCRVCIVEVETGGRRDFVTACVYPVERECVVYSNSENVLKQRRMVLRLLQAKAPQSETIAHLCDEYGVEKYGRFVEKENKKCIVCSLCINACRSLGTGAIGTAGRGVTRKVTTPYDEPSMVCVGCASCANVCPTGRIQISEEDGTRQIWHKTFSLVKCKSCGATLGTEMELWRAAYKAGADDIPEHCEACRKKAIADVLVATYGV